MRKKLKEQILQCVRDSELFDNRLSIMAESFVKWMLDECEPSGLLVNFGQKKYHVLIDIFNGSYNDYLAVLSKLSGAGFVQYDEQDLIVRVCTSAYFYKIKNQIYHKRKYQRQDEIKEQQTILESVNSIIQRNEENKLDSEVNKPNSQSEECFKIPDNLRPYLTSEPLEDKEIDEIESMYRKLYANEKIFRNSFFERIKLEEQRRNLSKMEKAVYAGLMLLSKDGRISTSTMESVRRELNRLLGKEFFKKTTFNDAIKKLYNLKLITIEKTYLEITDYSYGFKGRYIVITKKLFIDTFSKFKAAATRLFYWYWFGLNNGDERDKFGNSGVNKAVFFKIASKTNEDKEAKERYEKVKKITRKRNKTEMLEVIESLSDVFHFYIPVNQPTVMIVKVRKEYFVPKKDANIVKLEIDPMNQYPKKAKIVEELLQNRYYKFNEEEKKALVRTFSRAPRRVIDKIISFVDNRIRQSIEECWEEKYRIQNVIGYTIDRYQKYKLDLLELEEV